MKKFLLFLTLLISAIGLTHAAVQTITSTFTDQNLAVDNDKLGWTAVPSADSFENERGVKWGSNKKVPGTITLTSKDEINNITEISVVVACGADNAQIDYIKVRGTDILGGPKIFSTSGTDTKTVTATASKNSGSIIISLTCTKKRPLYVQSITVTYDDGTSGGEEPKLTDPEINWTLDGEPPLAEGADVKATLGSVSNVFPTLNLADGAGAHVTCSSSNEAVATVTDDGTVTIHAAGTTTITASTRANDATYKQASKSYTLTVIDPNATIIDSFGYGDLTFTESNKYWSFSYTNTTSGAEYAGYAYTATNNTKIQIKQTDNNGLYVSKVPANLKLSKIIITTSDSHAKAKITVYGNTTAFEATGTTGSSELGSLTGNGTLTINFNDNTNEALYGKAFNAFCVNAVGSYTVYISSVEVVWEPLQEGDIKAEPGLAYVETEVSKKMGYETIIFTNPLTNPKGLTVTYATEPINSSVATVDANGQVTVKAAGTVKIVASFAGDETYKAGSASYTLTVTDDKKYDTFNASALSFVGESGYRNFTYTGASGAIYGGFADANESTLMIHNQASGNSGVFVSQAPEGYKLGSVTVFSTTGDNLTLYANNKPYSSVSTDGKEIGNFGDGEQVALNLSGFQSNMTLYGLVPTTFCIFGNSSASSVTEIKVVWELDTRADAGIAFAEAAVSKAFSDESFTFTNKLTNTNSLAVTYSTDPAESEVATVDANSGEVTVKAAGTVTIVATSAETADYKPGTASYTITVAKQYVFADTKVTLVKDANTLNPGDIIVIAAYGTTSKGATWNCAMSTSSVKPYDNYRGVTNVNFNGDHTEITSIPNEVMLIELEQTQYNETDYWLFKTLNYTGVNGYLGNTEISSNKNNYMNVVTDGNTNPLCYATIESNDDNTVKVLFNHGLESSNKEDQSTGTTINKNYLQYNQGSPRFACYGLAQANGQVYIYKVETPQTIVGEDLTEVTMNEGQGPNTLSAMSLFSTNSTVNNFVVKMNGVTITSADVVREEDTEGNNNITVNLSGLPYIPGAEFTIAPVVNGVEGHSEALGIQMPALPTFNVTDSKASLTYDGKEAETGTCNIDVLVKLYITSTAGEGAKPFNYYFDIENKSGFVNHAWDWLNDDKGYGITYIVKDYLSNVTTQKQGEGENAIWTPVLPTDAKLYTTLEFDVKPYFAFYVTPELASLITEANPAPMAAPARAGEGFVPQNVYSTQVFEQQFNFSASSEVSGVEGVTIDANAPVEFFNLQGVRVDGDLAPGIYIRRQGQSVSKIQIR